MQSELAAPGPVEQFDCLWNPVMGRRRIGEQPIRFYEDVRHAFFSRAALDVARMSRSHIPIRERRQNMLLKSIAQVFRGFAGLLLAQALDP